MLSPMAAEAAPLKATFGNAPGDRIAAGFRSGMPIAADDVVIECQSRCRCELKKRV